ncbi:uncharacterized protein Z518_04129 [Rhinocladiella mackenziei CBS 650.93]|uniref:Uncharacterized protein n=1 Tax=Rhinocladiella mackenziei CBS 650.93 TaxID=1442369 RepID=A0A0D2JAL4_9EURO|nr:uncharacterized protein Z518_04129 [Rhinocladiella mackenziei CBS 650.93]KIX06155.1 hypothetical protein Z518_04129 [Rhinocladiella mackenziei CBS 650.93]
MIPIQNPDSGLPQVLAAPNTFVRTGQPRTPAVNMLACRLTSAALIFAAGDIASPQLTTPQREGNDPDRNIINYQFALSAIPLDFPSTREDKAMAKSRYMYGCSTSEGSFGAALGRAVKIDCLVKIDAEKLIRQGKKDPTLQPINGCVDSRSVKEILASKDENDPISVFQLPAGWYAQEPRFVPRHHSAREDDGWLLTYVIDESQLDSQGTCRPDAVSELWIINGIDMKTVVARVYLTPRVSYGLHGSFFAEDQVKSQRPAETIRGIKRSTQRVRHASWWQPVREWLEKRIG